MNRQCTGYDSANGMSRRQMLSRFGMGLGAVALAELESPLGAAATGPPHLGHLVFLPACFSGAVKPALHDEQ